MTWRSPRLSSEGERLASYDRARAYSVWTMLLVQCCHHHGQSSGLGDDARRAVFWYSGIHVP